MKSLHFTIRNVIFFIAIALLVGATISLARNRTRQLNALSQTTSTPVTTIVARPQEPASTEIPPTKMPTPRVYFGTPIPGPTRTPTPIPTPMEVVEPGQPVNGYIFSEARPVSNTIGYSLPFFDWLSDNSDQLLIVRGLTLEVMDITTGETQAYSDGKTMVANPIWLPARQAAAYLTFLVLTDSVVFRVDGII